MSAVAVDSSHITTTTINGETIVIPEHTPGAITLTERFWCQHQPWLEKQGYMLRPRYRPDWVPSWKGTDRDPFWCEDGAQQWVCSRL